MMEAATASAFIAAKVRYDNALKYQYNICLPGESINKGTPIFMYFQMSIGTQSMDSISTHVTSSMQAAAKTASSKAKSMVAGKVLDEIEDSQRKMKERDKRFREVEAQKERDDYENQAFSNFGRKGLTGGRMTEPGNPYWFVKEETPVNPIFTDNTLVHGITVDEELKLKSFQDWFTGKDRFLIYEDHDWDLTEYAKSYRIPSPEEDDQRQDMMFVFQGGSRYFDKVEMEVDTPRVQGGSFIDGSRNTTRVVTWEKAGKIPDKAGAFRTNQMLNLVLHYEGMLVIGHFGGASLFFKSDKSTWVKFEAPIANRITVNTKILPIRLPTNDGMLGFAIDGVIYFGYLSQQDPENFDDEKPSIFKHQKPTFYGKELENYYFRVPRDENCDEDFVAPIFSDESGDGKVDLVYINAESDIRFCPYKEDLGTWDCTDKKLIYEHIAGIDKRYVYISRDTTSDVCRYALSSYSGSISCLVRSLDVRPSTDDISQTAQRDFDITRGNWSFPVTGWQMFDKSFEGVYSPNFRSDVTGKTSGCAGSKKCGKFMRNIMKMYNRRWHHKQRAAEQLKKALQTYEADQRREHLLDSEMASRYKRERRFEQEVERRNKQNELNEKRNQEKDIQRQLNMETDPDKIEKLRDDLAKARGEVEEQKNAKFQYEPVIQDRAYKLYDKMINEGFSKKEAYANLHEKGFIDKQVFAEFCATSAKYSANSGIQIDAAKDVRDSVGLLTADTSIQGRGPENFYKAFLIQQRGGNLRLNVAEKEELVTNVINKEIREKQKPPDITMIEPPPPPPKPKPTTTPPAPPKPKEPKRKRPPPIEIPKDPLPKDIENVMKTKRTMINLLNLEQVHEKLDGVREVKYEFEYTPPQIEQEMDMQYSELQKDAKRATNDFEKKAEEIYLPLCIPACPALDDQNEIVKQGADGKPVHKYVNQEAFINGWVNPKYYDANNKYLFQVPQFNADGSPKYATPDPPHGQQRTNFQVKVDWDVDPTKALNNKQISQDAINPRTGKKIMVYDKRTGRMVPKQHKTNFNIDYDHMSGEMHPVVDNNGNQVYERDRNGRPILDADGFPVPKRVNGGNRVGASLLSQWTRFAGRHHNRIPVHLAADPKYIKKFMRKAWREFHNGYLSEQHKLSLEIEKSNKNNRVGQAEAERRHSDAHIKLSIQGHDEASLIKNLKQRLQSDGNFLRPEVRVAYIKQVARLIANLEPDSQRKLADVIETMGLSDDVLLETDKQSMKQWAIDMETKDMTRQNSMVKATQNVIFKDVFGREFDDQFTRLNPDLFEVHDNVRQAKEVAAAKKREREAINRNTLYQLESEIATLDRENIPDDDKVRLAIMAQMDEVMAKKDSGTFRVKPGDNWVEIASEVAELEKSEREALSKANVQFEEFSRKTKVIGDGYNTGGLAGAVDSPTRTYTTTKLASDELVRQLDKNTATITQYFKTCGKASRRRRLRSGRRLPAAWSLKDRRDYLTAVAQNKDIQEQIKKNDAEKRKSDPERLVAMKAQQLIAANLARRTSVEADQMVLDVRNALMEITSETIPEYQGMGGLDDEVYDKESVLAREQNDRKRQDQKNRRPGLDIDMDDKINRGLDVALASATSAEDLLRRLSAYMGDRSNSVPTVEDGKITDRKASSNALDEIGFKKLEAAIQSALSEPEVQRITEEGRRNAAAQSEAMFDRITKQTAGDEYNTMSEQDRRDLKNDLKKDAIELGIRFNADGTFTDDNFDQKTRAFESDNKK